MNIVLYMPSAKRLDWWTAQLGEQLPEHSVLSCSATTNDADIDIAVVWQPPAGWLASLPNLQLTVSIGAGVDHIVQDASYPADVPVLKTTGPEMIQRMREYVVLQVLRLHRKLPLLQQQQASTRWKSVVTPVAANRTVGIMGMGGMGQASARSLLELGFDVRCWSRTARQRQGIQSFAGDAQLQEFASSTEILICLLPLTEATRGILSEQLFACMPAGACLINAARGQHLVEQDLLDALAGGQLSQATLDVFAIEPLPEDHGFWQHPQILVTPHIASQIDPSTGSRIIADNIRRFANGEKLDALAEAAQGY